MKPIQILFLIIGVVILFLSCRKLDYNYKQFIENGEITYVGKADSLKVRGGDQRAEVSWLTTSDPNVSSYRIYWNNKQDSVSGSLAKSEEMDTIKVLINSINEDFHEFIVILFDDEGHSSLESAVTGRVYGEFYKSSLSDRVIKEFHNIFDGESGLELEWGTAPEGGIFSEVKYTDVDNNEITQKVSADAELDTLRNVPADAVLSVRTALLPNENSLDTFYTSFKSVKPEFEVYMLNKSSWQNAKLSDDSYEPAYAIERLWDGDGFDNLGSYFRLKAKTPAWKFPLWFTIDLGNSYYLDRMKVNQHPASSWIYGYDTPRIFEVYGSNVKSTNWDDWTSLGEFESIKPSGLPVGQLSEEDITQNLAGEIYRFNDVGKPFRYFRFKVLEQWDPSKAVGLFIEELTLWGY